MAPLKLIPYLRGLFYFTILHSKNTDPRQSLFLFLLCSLITEVKPEDVTDNFPNTTERKDEIFSRTKNQDMAEDCTLTENTQVDESSQDAMDCGSVGGLNESVTPGNRSNTAHCSNGQKTKRSSSPGPHPVKASCVAPNQPAKSTIKGANTHCEVDMQSPDSPLSKGMLVNSSPDKDQYGATCGLDSSFTESQVMESQPLVQDCDSECSSKDKAPPDAMGRGDAEVSDCSSTCEMMSQDFSESQSGGTSERYPSSSYYLLVIMNRLCYCDTTCDVLTSFSLSILSRHI